MLSVQIKQLTYDFQHYLFAIGSSLEAHIIKRAKINVSSDPHHKKFFYVTVPQSTHLADGQVTGASRAAFFAPSEICMLGFLFGAWKERTEAR